MAISDEIYEEHRRVARHWLQTCADEGENICALPPEVRFPWQWIEFIIFTLEEGLRNQDWGKVYHAQALLEEYHDTLK